MKHSFVLFAAACAILSSVKVVDSTCSASDGPCQVGSGNCTAAFRLAFQGDIQRAVASVFYGKYCGGQNKCQVIGGGSTSKSKDKSENQINDVDDDGFCEIDDDRYRSLKGKKKEKQGVGNGLKKKKGKNKEVDDTEEEGVPCPAVPCDATDVACMTHDACLDRLVVLLALSEGERVPFPERCACELPFIYDAVIQATTTQPTGLCDSAFYTEPLFPSFPFTGIELLRHEAAFVAAPSCCSILSPECQMDETADPEKLAVASGFCQKLKDAGLPICG